MTGRRESYAQKCIAFLKTHSYLSLFLRKEHSVYMLLAENVRPKRQISLLHELGRVPARFSSWQHYNLPGLRAPPCGTEEQSFSIIPTTLDHSKTVLLNIRILNSFLRMSFFISNSCLKNLYEYDDSKTCKKRLLSDFRNVNQIILNYKLIMDVKK